LGGAQAFVWDGRDDQGALVPPGLYIGQIDAATDAADVSGQQVAHLVGVVY
jgi:flagellar hook assembly protein FlgD